jgi:hypothetical protein
MINVKKEGIVLSKTTLAFEDEAVLNPAIYQDGNTIHMLYRAVRKGNYSTIGYAKFEGPLNLVHRNVEPLLVPLFDYVSNIINTECKKVFDLIELELGYYWININGNGSYNESHHHMGGVSNGKKQSILSGVFYLNVPDGDCGDIVFIKKDGKEASVKPTNGDLLLFSPSLLHRVEKNNTNGERISIAFNYIKSHTYQINNIL